MQVDEKPTEDYSDIGGLDKQIQELVEAVVLPVTHKERFTNLGIKPPKGVLLYGPPGTGALIHQVVLWCMLLIQQDMSMQKVKAMPTAGICLQQEYIYFISSLANQKKPEPAYAFVVGALYSAPPSHWCIADACIV